ncbi:TPA: hypothetical protein ACG3OA_002871 [Legionella pneumophila]|uniref:hypothetical protein n=1 Tax=Legionella pneumophila TaxID=446 RepID=UPI000D073104|nr:hypothetical protein [Legionella pneumophila]MCH9115408.1 hypothetical protein [Legionella pneumophila serogroup 1]HAT1821668.1 hypothetical protein [Legionella pneumophila]HAU1134298.1 hypothetical protein [Legionella pneumophila]HAU1180747.1 hypothetical protein [Legionella pneumophila]HAU1598903.1 hypothetical protein [Legionella pneumophila]
MDVSVEEFLVVLYVVGGLITLSYSIKSLFNFQRLKSYYNRDLLLKRPDIKIYLFLKPIFWPYFFVTEKSPTERLSELFFKHYGDEGHTYFGNQGLKNFLNDLLKGKNRYTECQIKSLCWSIDKNSQDWMDYKKIFHDDNLYAHIIYTKIQDKYLLRVTWEKESAPRPAASVSRFELDQCERLSESEFKTRMKQINATEANRLCHDIKSTAE